MTRPDDRALIPEGFHVVEERARNLFDRKRSEGQKGAEVIVAKRGQVAVRS